MAVINHHRYCCSQFEYDGTHHATCSNAPTPSPSPNEEPPMSTSFKCYACGAPLTDQQLYWVDSHPGPLCAPCKGHILASSPPLPPLAPVAGEPRCPKCGGGALVLPPGHIKDRRGHGFIPECFVALCVRCLNNEIIGETYPDWSRWVTAEHLASFDPFALAPREDPAAARLAEARQILNDIAWWFSAIQEDGPTHLEADVNRMIETWQQPIATFLATLPSADQGGGEEGVS